MEAIVCFSEEDYKKAKKDRSGFFLLVFSSIDTIKETERTVYVPLEPINDPDLVGQYVNEVMKLENELLLASLNNTYYYGVATLVGICRFIRKELSQLDISTVYLYGVSTHRYVPSLYTAWGESSKNLLASTNCFAKYVYEGLTNDYDVIDATCINVLSILRETTLRYMRLLVTPIILTALSIKKLRFKSPSLDNSDIKISYFIIRNRHQLNNAKSVIKALKLDINNVVIVEIEALSSTGLLNEIRMSGYKYLSPHVGCSGLLNTIFSLFLSYCNVAKFMFFDSIGFFHIANGRISIRIKDIALDSFIQPQVLLYKKQLFNFQKLLRKRLAQGNVFSFEQVSPQAYLDNLLLSEHSDLYFLKSTLIQNVSIPCICWGECFYVNDEAELSLKDYTYLNKSAVTYNGSPKYSALYGIKAKYSPQLGKIVFATQPHEASINQNIIDVLIRMKDELGFKVIVRKHPRDEVIYKLGCGYDILFDNNSDLYSQLADADIVVSRTSTILEECIYIGVPYISCLYSAKDRMYSAKYVSSNSNLVVTDVDTFISKLVDYSGTVKCFITWRHEYLKNFRAFSFK